MAKQTKAPTKTHLYILALALTAVVVTLSAYVLRLQTVNIQASELLSQKEVSPKQCETKGNPVINVTQKLANTVDSGEGGNNWAFDNLNRQMKVYKESDNTFCVLVDNEGKFDSQAGQQSPGNTGVLTGNEDGTFKGGYRARVTGALKTTPDYKTQGNLGTVDYACTIAGACPGYTNWVDKYFSPGYTFSYEWWGWEYTYKNLKWVNSSDGNSGDIL
jgi:hypothetical protein